MLKHRLIFGFLMAAALTGLLLLDGWLDDYFANLPKASITFALFLAVSFLASKEMTKLLEKAGANVSVVIIWVFSAAIGTYSYSGQFAQRLPEIFNYTSLVMPICIWLIFLYQGFEYKTKGVILNCGATILAVLYLGLMGQFFMNIRFYFGVMALLMYIATVKSADIGAYTVGRLIGKHKFSPDISPGKTWEGMFGAWLFSCIVAVSFARMSGLMLWWQGLLFGLIFAFAGQLGDLAESMLKRDAQEKDSSNAVPGFGGVLDIIDSLLMAAPAAYVFFLIVIKHGRV